MGWRRRYGKPDQNQPQLVKDARRSGLSVAVTTGGGDDFPDLVLGWRGLTVLVEVKRDKAKLTGGQDAFRKTWTGGPILTVRTFDELVDGLLALDAKVYTEPPR